MTDRPIPKKIWLSPFCPDADDDERTWCDTDQGPCDECGTPAVEYVQADLVDSLIAAKEEAEKGAAKLDQIGADLATLLHEADMRLSAAEKQCEKLRRALEQQTVLAEKWENAFHNSQKRLRSAEERIVREYGKSSY